VAYLEQKIQEVKDKELRETLLAEVEKLKKDKKFGLVFEEHVPEAAPVYSAPIRRNATVAFKDGDFLDTYRVVSIKNGIALLRRDRDESEVSEPLKKLVVVKRVGEVIYPALIHIDSVHNGGDRPYHTLIESENYRPHNDYSGSKP
jgi:adenine-specific DNA-methyltransferase